MKGPYWGGRTPGRDPGQTDLLDWGLPVVEEVGL